jgi:hypothetical protein
MRTHPGEFFSFLPGEGREDALWGPEVPGRRHIPNLRSVAGTHADLYIDGENRGSLKGKVLRFDTAPGQKIVLIPSGPPPGGI